MHILKLIFLSLHLWLGSFARQNSQLELAGSIEPLVVGGNVATPGEFPWIVNIRVLTESKGEQLLCGGTLIELNVVLTAAHCLINETTKEILPLHKLIVVAGDYKFTSYDGTEQNSTVENIRIHEKYNGKINDIALIKLSTKLKATLTVSPGFLPSFNVLELTKTTVVAGWGITENGTTSEILLKAEIPIISDPEKCGVNKNLQICAGGDGVDSCNGDSGSPLMCVPRFNYVCGIVSYGLGEYCGIKPGVYTNVYHYMDWIRQNKGFKPILPLKLPTVIVIGIVGFTVVAVAAMILTFHYAFKRQHRNTDLAGSGAAENDNLIPEG